MAAAISEKVKELRSRCFLTILPDDFLRIPASPQQQQEAADRQAALALHQQYSSSSGYTAGAMGRLSITVVQAKLAKNYGMTRMDPYCRLRVGHYVYETNTDSNGGKTPRWNKVVQCVLPYGVNIITVEIFDECSFTMDELIAWSQITIPRNVLLGETHEDWYPLNGKQGEGVEGMINLVLSYGITPTYMYPMPPPVVIVPKIGSVTPVAPLNVYTQPQLVNETPVLSETDLKQIEEMFPTIDKDVIKTVFEANRGNKEGAINSLLQMID